MSWRSPMERASRSMRVTTTSSPGRRNVMMLASSDRPWRMSASAARPPLSNGPSGLVDDADHDGCDLDKVAFVLGNRRRRLVCPPALSTDLAELLTGWALGEPGEHVTDGPKPPRWLLD